jgi:hypothetical protein
MHSMDRFHAVELQQHEYSYELQVSPGTFVLNSLTESGACINIVAQGTWAAFEALTTGVADLSNAFVCPARALADHRRVPVELICRAHSCVLRVGLAFCSMYGECQNKGVHDRLS